MKMWQDLFSLYCGTTEQKTPAPTRSLTFALFVTVSWGTSSSATTQLTNAKEILTKTKYREIDRSEGGAYRRKVTSLTV